MAGIRWSKEEDDIIRKNFEGMDSYAIAALLPKRTRKAVVHRAKTLGLRKTLRDKGRISHEKWLQQLANQLGEPLDIWLKRRYVDEKATYRELCNEAKINTRSLMKLMHQFNIEPISPSEAAKRQINNSPDFLNNWHKNKNSPQAKQRRALTRQKRWKTVQSPKEAELLAALNKAGLSPVCELAVDIFNVDFAFPSIKLAVELDPRWHNAGRKVETGKRKDKTLSDLGWTVLRLDGRTSVEYNVAKVSEAFSSLASTQPR